MYYVGGQILPGEKVAEVIGFATWEELKPVDGGDYPAYARVLNLLHPIGSLLDMMQDACES